MYYICKDLIQRIPRDLSRGEKRKSLKNGWFFIKQKKLNSTNTSWACPGVIYFNFYKMRNYTISKVFFVLSALLCSFFYGQKLEGGLLFGKAYTVDEIRMLMV